MRVQARTSNLERRPVNVEIRRSNFELRSSNFEFRSSNFEARTSNVEAATAFKSRLGKITKNSHVHYDATTVLTLKTWISAKDLHLHVQFG